MDQLIEMYKDKDWFHSVGLDEFGRHVVYVKYMCPETQEIPQFIEGNHILVHFAGYKMANKSQFANYVSFTKVENSEEVNLADLWAELDRLERICGSNILECIFYEEHDQDDATTNLSEKYPEVRQSIHGLYELYGFDVIYNELTVNC